MTVTEALEALAAVGGDTILLVADPTDGLAVVLWWEDPARRLAFTGEATNLDGDDLALYLVGKAANYLANKANDRGDLRRAVRLRTVAAQAENAIG
jgi:uracil-DNA glycosylase